MAGAVGCASNSGPSTAQVPANTIPPSASSVRGLGVLTSRSISAGGDATAVNEHSLTGGAAARGFDFGDNGQPAAGGGTLTMETLGQMLQSIGGNPQLNNNVYLYSIKDESGLTYPFGVSLSQDGKAIYMVVPMFNVDPQGWASQDALLKLLAANSSICPASFGIVDTKLFLLLGIANTNVNQDLLKQAISYVFETVHKTQPLWGGWMQQGGQGGNTGGGNPGGGNPGGGNPGGGNPGGGNPFQ
ncbi:MAG: hypothetical protein ABSB42_08725 [Tepidisphaeraceae bacterium]|jgi:hypothetical protein